MRREDLLNYAPMPEKAYDSLMVAARNVKEEEAMKKKVSVGLVFAIIMILLAGIAFAIAHFTEYAGKIADMEAEKGYYDTWEVDDRAALVKMLVESGVLPEDERVKTLLSGTLDNAAASALATEIIVDWGPAREDAITLMSVLESVWGRYPNEWSPENLVWYMETMEAKGQKQETRFYIPEGGVMSKEQAIAFAIEYIKPLVDYPQEVWDGYTVSATYESMYHADNDDPYWYVSFQPPTRWTTRTYIPAVVIDPRTGEIYSDEIYLTPEQALAERQAEIDSADPTRFMRFMTHEERAEVYKDNYYVGCYTVPDPSCISEEEALAIAKKAFMEERGYTEEQLAGLTPYAFFTGDSGGGRPAWAVKYYDETVKLPDQYVVLSVDMFADTGEIYVWYPWEY